MTEIDNVLEYLPSQIKNILLESDERNIEEIRMRNNRILSMKIGQELKTLNYMVRQQDILQTFEKVCENSVYSYRKQICDGYITIKGGHRVGIVGSAVLEDNKVININYISSLNFRIARQKIGCSDEIIKDIISNNEIYNTLIISPPGCGKTTLLRDIIRNISNGTNQFKGKNVGVVDDRGAIAAMYKGIPQNDIGIRTDVIDNMPKSRGMRLLVRSMSPDVIACDEIGSLEDIEAIDYAMCSGVRGIFTAHGKDINEINRNPEISKLLNKHIFERLIIINPRKRGDVQCIQI